MPGSDTSASRSRVELTGMRRPRHPGQLAGIAPRTLRPFAMQPIRPGEILESVSMVGDLYFTNVCNLVQAPLTYAEVACWYIPLHAYGPDFTTLFTTDAEDLVERNTFGVADGTVGVTDNPVADNRIAAGGYSQINRPWAGEIGELADVGTSYVPWVSHGAYITADTYYGLSTTLDFRDDGLLSNPPGVSPWIRGASINRHDINTGVDIDPSGQTSLTDMLEDLYIMSSPDRSFAEVLGGFGVSPSAAAGMPVPIVTEQIMLRPQHNPQIVSGLSPSNVVSAAQDGVEGGYSGSLVGGPVTPFDPDLGIITSLRPMGQLAGQVHVNRRRGLRAQTFGMLMATVVFYPIFSNQTSMGHVMDATRMLNLGHWGDPSFGGIEEVDFMTVQDLRFRDGTTGADQQVMNMLNLLLHGDEFADHDINTFPAFRFLGTGNEAYGGANLDFLSKISTQFNIRTDLIGN